jgi:hypothetical protein
MKTVFLLLMLMSSPNQATIKYNGILYYTEVECEIARVGYMDAYENKNEEYKKTIITEAFCIPFDAFPLIKTKGIGA